MATTTTTDPDFITAEDDASLASRAASRNDRAEAIRHLLNALEALGERPREGAVIG